MWGILLHCDILSENEREQRENGRESVGE
uniref:Uncharacterized protein n=1 Tax=Rhizophora mucronata TaxID=61149 RepID=A0A2P2NQ80_RHIMU